MDATPVSGHIQSHIRFNVDDGAAFPEIARFDKGGLAFTASTGLRGSNGSTSANAGDVGQLVQTSNLTSSGPLTASTIGTYLIVFSLTAGDWDVWMHSTVVCAAASPSTFECELQTGSGLSGNNLITLQPHCPSLVLPLI